MPVCARCRRRRRLFSGLLCACCLALAVCDARTAQRATACITQRPILQCSQDERIVVRKLLHSYDPNPCLNPHPDNNCTVEDSNHLNEVVSECNGRAECRSYPLRDFEGGPEAPAWCRINKAVYANRKEKFNYMDVTYDCESDTFCTELSRHGRGMAVIKTRSYPAPTAPTSSSCECQFSVNTREAKNLKAYVTCPNSTVRFRYESVSQHSTTSVKESEELLCKEAGDGSPLLLVSVPSGRSLTVSVVEDGSDERSAYGVSVTAFRLSDEVGDSIPVSVTCKGSTVVFTRTEKIIIGVTIPGLVIIVILVVIAAKIFCIRRKSRQPLAENEAAPQARSCGDGSAPSEHSYNIRPQYAAGDDRYVSSSATTMVRSSSTSWSSDRKSVHAAEKLSRDPSNADLVAFAVRLHNNRKLLEPDGVASLRASNHTSSFRSISVCGPTSRLQHSAGGSYQQLAEHGTASNYIPLERLATVLRSSAVSCSPSSCQGAAAPTETPSPRVQPSAPPRPSSPPPPIPSPQTVPPQSKCEHGGSVDVVRSAERPRQAATGKPLPPPKPSKLTLRGLAS